MEAHIDTFSCGRPNVKTGILRAVIGGKVSERVTIIPDLNVAVVAAVIGHELARALAQHETQQREENYLGSHIGKITKFLPTPWNALSHSHGVYTHAVGKMLQWRQAN
jgi:alkyl hydroperoxide reductase subunit AhpF